jgi:hypothetical protein
VTRDGRRIATLRACDPAPTLAQLPALLRSLPHLPLSEAETFAADIDAARAELRSESPNR